MWNQPSHPAADCQRHDGLGYVDLMCFSAQMYVENDGRPVALVLGALVRPGGVPSPSLKRRALCAADLWHRGEIRAILVSGGGAVGETEAEVALRLCHAAGVPSEVLFAEVRARNTFENLQLSLPLLDQLGRGPMILVTDRYHAARALMTARHFGLQAQVSCPARPLSAGIVRAWLRETAALPVYWWRLRRR